MSRIRFSNPSPIVALLAILVSLQGPTDEELVIGRTDLVELSPLLLNEIRESGGVIIVKSFKLFENELPFIVVELTGTRNRSVVLLNQLETIEIPFRLGIHNSAYKSSDLDDFPRCSFAAKGYTITKLSSTKITCSVEEFGFCETFKFLTGVEIQLGSADIDDGFLLKVEGESAWKVLRTVAARNNLELRANPTGVVLRQCETKRMQLSN